MQTYVTNAATVLIFGIFCPLSLARRSAAESLTRFDAQKWDESSLATAQKDPPQSKRSLERSAAASADAATAATGKAAAAAAARAIGTRSQLADGLVIHLVERIERRLVAVVMVIPPVAGVVVLEIVAVAQIRRHGLGQLSQHFFRNAQGNAHHQQFVPQD